MLSKLHEACVTADTALVPKKNTIDNDTDEDYRKIKIHLTLMLIEANYCSLLLLVTYVVVTEQFGVDDVTVNVTQYCVDCTNKLND
jgi:hypothetical protein